jgi:Protein-tyrosine-phosphatase
MKLLFICTGNTCRSPMAMCMANALGHEAQSAGMRVGWQGLPASEGAFAAMKSRGLDISAHRNQQVNEKLLHWADKIICATNEHSQRLAELYPVYQGKITAFSPPIFDPYGYSEDVYERTAALIESQLKEMFP